MDKTEPVVCSECAAEPDELAATQYTLTLSGWDFTGEFGPRCPECVVKNPAMEPVEGIGALAKVIEEGKEKK